MQHVQHGTLPHPRDVGSQTSARLEGKGASCDLPASTFIPTNPSLQGIKRMKASGRLAAQVLEYAGTLAKPGVTTDQIDKAVHKMIIDAGAYPSPLNYGGFPKSVCTSVNECVCHGIPDDRPLEDGDIVNIDVTVYLDGYHGDTSRMFYVGGCGVWKDLQEQSVRSRRLHEIRMARGIRAQGVCGNVNVTAHGVE